MTKDTVMAELNSLRAGFCNGAGIHEFSKTCITVELAASYCDMEGVIHPTMEPRINDCMKKLTILSAK